MSMPRLICALVVCCLSLASAWAAGERRPPQRKAAAEEPYSARVIVQYKADSTLMRAQSAATAAAARPQHAATLGARLGLVLRDGWVLGPRMQALRAQGLTSADLARRLAAQPDVEWAVVDGRKRAAAVVPNDPFYGSGLSAPYPAVGQWYLRAPDATFVSAINAVGAWATTTGNVNVTVAVLDTGIRPEHPDFKRADNSSKLYAGYDFIAAEPGTTTDFTTAADGNGRDGDPTDPGDSCSGDPSSWHGTQTASIIGAATDNGIGLASVGREVMVQPVRVLGKCGGYDSDIIAAMRWAGGIAAVPEANPHPAKVLNMSLGSDGPCSAAYQSVFNDLYAAGVSVVVAAGNGVDTPAPGGGIAVGTPANCPHAIAVGGLRHAGSKVGYSNLGPENVVSAPAGNCINLVGNCLYPIMTATNAGTTTAAGSTYTDMVDAAIGTSFSAPQVAGAVALMLSVNASLTPDEIRLALKGGARPFPTTGASSAGIPQCSAPSATPQDECYCTTSTCGAGMLDVAASVARVVPGNTVGPYVELSASSTAPTAGANVTFSTAGSGAFGGRSIASYAWSVTAGGSSGAISGSATGSSATLATTAAGDVTVQLVVTDSGGHATTKTTTVSVQAAPSPAPSSGGGGGAFGPAWLALLALGVLALRRRP